MNPLTVFPRHPSAPDTYYINGAWAPAAITAVDKRFTDAELAAEYWMLCYYGAGAQFNEASSEDPYSEEFWEEHYDRLNTLYRFCTLPHHDDGPA